MPRADAGAIAAGVSAYRPWEQETSYRGDPDASDSDVELLISWLYQAFSRGGNFSTTKSETSFDNPSKTRSTLRNRPMLYSCSLWWKPMRFNLPRRRIPADFIASFFLPLTHSLRAIASRVFDIVSALSRIGSTCALSLLGHLDCCTNTRSRSRFLVYINSDETMYDWLSGHLRTHAMHEPSFNSSLAQLTMITPNNTRCSYVRTPSPVAGPPVGFGDSFGLLLRFWHGVLATFSVGAVNPPIRQALADHAASARAASPMPSATRLLCRKSNSAR